MREFIPYGTPCDEPCEPCEPDDRRLAELEAQMAALKGELDALRSAREREPEPEPRSGTDS